MFKIIKCCPLCGSTKKTKLITNSKNVYSYFLSKIMNLKEDFILKNLQNYKCKKCELIYKKKWIHQKFIKKIYKDFQPTHPGGLNTLKKNFGKKKFIELIKKYKYFFIKKNNEFSDKSKREIIKILNNSNNKKINFVKLKKRFIQNLANNDLKYIEKNYLTLSDLLDKPKLYSQFSGFRSNEISKYLKKNINLKNINSYAEIGCPLWGNYDFFNKPWIKKYFINIDEQNFWKADKKKSDNCLKYLSKNVEVLKNINKKQIDFISIYNFLDHIEDPLRLFNKDLKNIKYFGIICEDINLSKKIDCQHFSSWNHKSILYLAKKIGYNLNYKPLRLSNTIYKLYILEKDN